MKYAVYLTWTLGGNIVVDANTAEEAITKAVEAAENGETPDTNDMQPEYVAASEDVVLLTLSLEK